MKDIKDQADSRKNELEEELEEVLEKTLKGLEELQHFLDAVEMLAVTSLSVFMDESFTPQGVSSMFLRSMITAARTAAPLLVHFKRDAKAFFLASLSIVEVLIIQLDEYTRVTQQICEKMEIRWMDGNASREMNLIMSEESMQTLYDHLLQLKSGKNIDGNSGKFPQRWRPGRRFGIICGKEGYGFPEIRKFLSSH